MKSPALLELTDVSVRYPGALSPSLSGVTLCVREGEVVALLGANGAGKSTLLRVAAGLVPVTGGSAQMEGREVNRISRREIARVMAFVPQNEGIASGFRVREVVAMGRAAHQNLWMREQAADRTVIEEAMAHCDLTHLSNQRIETLSGGEQRRVAVARALAQKPRVLLLDEPGAFLDVRHRLELYARLSSIANSLRIASLCTMHDLDTAARFATRVILLLQGRVVADGTPADVMTAAQLARVLGMQVAVGLHEPTRERYFLPLPPAKQ